MPHHPQRVTGGGPARIQLQVPVAVTARFGPEFLQPFRRRHLFRRSVTALDRCRACGESWECGPACTIQSSGDRLRFDYDRCIRCYWCIEVCPLWATTSAETAAGRWRRYLRSCLRGKDSGEDL